VKVASADWKVPKPQEQGEAATEGEWSGFAAGAPHPADWQRPGPGVLDFLVMQPPGRYLYVSLRLRGDARTTPVVRRIRLEFERVTSLEFLPAVYREVPLAEDFTERFLTLFDRSIEEIDDAIRRAPALFDPGGVPERVLEWLGGLLDVAFEESWSLDRKRAILRAVPSLYRRRGTVSGLRDAVAAVFGVAPAIEELAPTRAWAGIGHGAVVGSARVFGAARARLRLGSSALCTSAIRSYGDLATDALQAEAHRFRVLMPAGVLATPSDRARLQRFVDGQKPAHTIALTRVGGSGLVVGLWSAIGVDTAFTPLPAPVLGAAGNVRLRRMSVLWPGTRETGGIVVGGMPQVGITTVME
jgi:phage tail-like protein